MNWNTVWTSWTVIINAWFCALTLSLSLSISLSLSLSLPLNHWASFSKHGLMACESKKPPMTRPASILPLDDIHWQIIRGSAMHRKGANRFVGPIMLPLSTPACDLLGFRSKSPPARDHGTPAFHGRRKHRDGQRCSPVPCWLIGGRTRVGHTVWGLYNKIRTTSKKH